MQTEIQNLIDHPEAIRETLNTDQLDGLIRKATAIWGQSITMQYRVTEGRSGARFEAESKEDLVGSSGIFSKVLTECRIDTFRLIPFEFDKSGCPKTVQEIKALPNIDWQIIQRYLKEEEFLDGNLVQGKHTEIENRIFNESQEMLHLCIEVRSHLWI